MLCQCARDILFIKSKIKPPYIFLRLTADDKQHSNLILSGLLTKTHCDLTSTAHQTTARPLFLFGCSERDFLPIWWTQLPWAQCLRREKINKYYI